MADSNGSDGAPPKEKLAAAGSDGNEESSRPVGVDRHAATWGSIYFRISDRRDLCDRRVLDHDQGALRWQKWAAPVTLLTAILAGISGLSVVTDSGVLAVIFSLATALVAALNASLKPAETAKSQRAAATAYDRLRLKLDDFLTFDVNDKWDDRPSKSEVSTIRKRMQELDAELYGIEESHPPLKGTFVRSHAKPGKAVLNVDPEVVSGEPINVSFARGPGNAWDYVGIFSEEDGAIERISARFWQYVGGGQNPTVGLKKGSLSFSGTESWDGDQPWWPPKEGRYVAYLFENGTRRILASAGFTVTSGSDQAAIQSAGSLVANDTPP